MSTHVPWFQSFKKFFASFYVKADGPMPRNLFYKYPKPDSKPFPSMSFAIHSYAIYYSLDVFLHKNKVNVHNIFEEELLFSFRSTFFFKCFCNLNIYKFVRAVVATLSVNGLKTFTHKVQNKMIQIANYARSTLAH